MNDAETRSSSELVHNRREIRKIVVSREGDGSFAIVDIDTLWRTQLGTWDPGEG